MKNQDLMIEIEEIFTNNKGRYGVRRVYKELVNRGHKLNHKKVQRLMNKLGLKGKCHARRYNSYRGSKGKTADNLIKRNFKADKPFEKWTTDISQFTCSWGKCYLSPILDMCTNEIISYSISDSPNMKLITTMLENAKTKFPGANGMILHSDRGWQYQHFKYTDFLKSNGLKHSMSRKGNCYDNSIMETFFGRLKTEMFYGNEMEFTSMESLKKGIDDYIDYYNHQRIQKKTNWMPPVEFRKTSSLNLTNN